MYDGHLRHISSKNSTVKTRTHIYQYTYTNALVICQFSQNELVIRNIKVLQ